MSDDPADPTRAEPADLDAPPGLDDLREELADELGLRGFDLVAGTTVEAYHDVLGRRDDGAFGLPDYPSWRAEPGKSRAVFLVGSSRAVWPHFKAALAADPRRTSEQHPFDRWTSEVISRAVVMVVGPHYAFDVRFAFEGGVRAFSALHLAQAAGLAHRGPAGLAISPLFGPWLALRAAVVVDMPGRPAAAPDPVCDRCADKPCMVALAAAMGQRDRADIAHDAVRERWRDWLAVRDACPVGRDLRYGDEQIRWHYAHDRGALE